MSLATFDASLSGDSRFGVPAQLEARAPPLPADDPVERLRAEEAFDSTLLLRVLSAAVAVFALALTATWLG